MYVTDSSFEDKDLQSERRQTHFVCVSMRRKSELHERTQ
jgi:hypothetical protein